MFGISTTFMYIFIIGLGAIMAGLTGIFERIAVHEGFRAGQPGTRCGVDLPICSFGTQCINGFCSKPEFPPVIATTLPVYP